MGRRRMHNDNDPANAVKVYPTAYAVRRQGLVEPRPVSLSCETDPQIRCAQCGATIEVPDAVASCWLCGSDNFTGSAR